MDSLLVADWPAPPSVQAVSSTRQGGFSASPYHSLNLGLHVGDDPDSVHNNRALYTQQLSGEPVWLNQIHSNKVLKVEAIPDHIPDADGLYTRQRGLALTVMTADCLPIVICDRNGTEIAAVHAGWRGLAMGIVSNALRCFESETSHLIAWLGPAIGQQYFEVGTDVKQAFLSYFSHCHKQVDRFFIPHQSNKYWAHLSGLARLELERLGVGQIIDCGMCTFSMKQQFFSYRRDGQTGRMATSISLI